MRSYLIVNNVINSRIMYFRKVNIYLSDVRLICWFFVIKLKE